MSAFFHDFFHTIETLATCALLGFMGFAGLCALPKSKLRGMVLEVASWVFFGMGGLYIVSPVSMMPGPIDEMGVAGMMVAAYKTAKSGQRERKIEEEKEELELTKLRNEALGATVKAPNYKVEDEPSRH